MAERDHGRMETKTPQENHFSCLSQLFRIFLTSMKIIILDNPKHFLTIYFVSCLPLSLLLTSLSMSTRALKSHIARLEWLVNVVPIWIEADNVRDESRVDFKALRRLKALHGIPIILFSFIALISLVSSTSLSYNKKRPTIRTSFLAMQATWARALVTCMASFVVRLTWEAIYSILIKVSTTRYLVVVMIVSVAVEVYLIAVISVAIVFSVVEECAGLDPFRVGFGLMKGRKFICGWVLSGLIMLLSNCIGREIVAVTDGRDFGLNGEDRDLWTVRMRYSFMVGLVMLLGLLVLWSYVVATVFYFDCRKRNVTIGREDGRSNHDEIDLDVL